MSTQEQLPCDDHRRFLPNSRTCFVCGEDNPAGLRTRFYVEADTVRARLSPQTHHCGYRNVVHGGVVAALLDETMGWAAARALRLMFYTAELTVRYLSPVPGDRETLAVAGVVKSTRRLAVVRGDLVDEAGAVYAHAEGRYIPFSPEETLAVDDQLLYRGGEERVFDELRATLRGGACPAEPPRLPDQT